MNLQPMTEGHNVFDQKKNAKAAFTLIELLVVIAIIAILAAILFPVFGRARENARRTSCLSNMKQIGLGIMQYTQDYDEFLCPSRNTVGGAPTPWHMMIQPYVKSFALFKCPSNTMPDGLGVVNYAGAPAFGPLIPRSYFSNGGAETGIYGTNGARPMVDNVGKALAIFDSPSTTILICERNDKDTTSYNNDKLNDSRQIYSTAFGPYFTNHLGMTSFAFADGHAKALKPTATIQPLNMWIVNNQTTAPSTNWINATGQAQNAMS